MFPFTAFRVHCTHRRCVRPTQGPMPLPASQPPLPPSQGPRAAAAAPPLVTQLTARCDLRSQHRCRRHSLIPLALLGLALALLGALRHCKSWGMGSWGLGSSEGEGGRPKVWAVHRRCGQGKHQRSGPISVRRFLGCLGFQNRNHSRQPKFQRTRTEAETENRKNQYFSSVRFGFWFLVKMCAD